jgi:hypothetical protein
MSEELVIGAMEHVREVGDDETLTPVRPSEVLPFPRLTAVQRNEAKLFALQIVRDPLYRKNLLQAARERRLAPQVEVALLAYAYGKPTEHVEVGRPGDFGDFSRMSEDELAERAFALGRGLRRGMVAQAAMEEAEARLATDEELERKLERMKEKESA